jgi:hypothetical protein
MKNAVFWDITPCGSCKNFFDAHTIAKKPLPSNDCCLQNYYLGTIVSSVFRHRCLATVLHAKAFNSV